MIYCDFNKTVRDKVFCFIDEDLVRHEFDVEVKFMARLNGRKSDKAKVIIASWVEMIYCILIHRNISKLEGRKRL